MLMRRARRSLGECSTLVVVVAVGSMVRVKI